MQTLLILALLAAAGDVSIVQKSKFIPLRTDQITGLNSTARGIWSLPVAPQVKRVDCILDAKNPDDEKEAPGFGCSCIDRRTGTPAEQDAAAEAGVGSNFRGEWYDYAHPMRKFTASEKTAFAAWIATIWSKDPEDSDRQGFGLDVMTAIEIENARGKKWASMSWERTVPKAERHRQRIAHKLGQ